MLRYYALAGLSLLALLPSRAHADDMMDVHCTEPKIAWAVVQSITAWAQGFPFARVIIGEEGNSGALIDQRVTSYSDTVAHCRGRYELWRTAKDGGRYKVALEPVRFQVEDLGGAYQVTLEDMPLSLKDSKMNSKDLLGRFSIDGRSYLDVLAENQRRLQMLKQKGRQ